MKLNKEKYSNNQYYSEIPDFIIIVFGIYIGKTFIYMKHFIGCHGSFFEAKAEINSHYSTNLWKKNIRPLNTFRVSTTYL